MRQWKREHKEAVNLVARNYYKNNPLVKPKKREFLQKWRYEGYERQLFRYAKRNAVRKGLTFEIELSDIVIPEFCPILGIELDKPGPVGGKRPDGRPSLDRRDNSKGYVKGNVFVVSWRANRLKCYASIEELEAILSYMKRPLT
jgi:hypothetical protein